MANLNHNPQRFLRQGHAVNVGGDFCIPRVDLTVPQHHARRHEDFYVAIVEPIPLEQDWDHHRALIANFVQDELHYERISPPAGPQPGPDDAADEDPDDGYVWQFGNPGNQGARGWDEAVQQHQAANEQQEDA
uniref:DUF7597 domain-containing protein n=1 Tax=Oryza barthii TaxID=65489 RepID=A0A0D3GGH9_9ORYZ